MRENLFLFAKYKSANIVPLTIFVIFSPSGLNQFVCCHFYRRPFPSAAAGRQAGWTASDRYIIQMRGSLVCPDIRVTYRATGLWKLTKNFFAAICFSITRLYLALSEHSLLALMSLSKLRSCYRKRKYTSLFGGLNGSINIKLCTHFFRVV